jgi:hypothetical protein
VNRDRKTAEGIILGVVMGAPIWLLFFLAIHLILEWLKS